MVKLAKNGAEVKRYLRSVQDQEVVRLLLRRLAQLSCWGYKKRLRMIIDARYVMFESGAGEDVQHLLVTRVLNLRGIGRYWWMT